MPAPLSGVTDVPTAGTAVQISNTSRRVLSIVFVAPSGNSGIVYVGNDGAGDVSATTGIPLSAGQSVSFNFGQFSVSVPISDFWVDAATNGDDVAWAAEMWS